MVGNRSSGLLMLWAVVAGIWILGTWDSTWWVNTYFPAAMVVVAGVLLLFDVIQERRRRK
jgi:hypothetical protein